MERALLLMALLFTGPIVSAMGSVLWPAHARSIGIVVVFVLICATVWLGWSVPSRFGSAKDVMSSLTARPRVRDYCASHTGASLARQFMQQLRRRRIWLFVRHIQGVFLR